ncbi:restriction endonuclease subunit S [Empedobacter falsenii]
MENLQPKLRFPEFKEDWKLSDYRNLVKLNQGLQISIDKRYTEYRDGLHFYITNEFLKKDSNKKFYIENPPLSCICTEDDILMTRTGNTGKVVTNVKGAFHNNFFRINYDKKNTYKNFLFYELTREKTQNKIISLAGTSTIPDLNHTDFYSLKINIPTLQEQTKIADFLGAVDKQLDILNQKKEKLNLYKKGVMQQLFSQQIRFKNDNGNDFPDWQEKTLGEVANSFNGLTGKTAKDFGEGKKYIQYKQIFDKPYIDTNDCGLVNIQDDEKQNQCKIGDVFFTVSSETKEEIAMSSVIENSINIPLYLNSFCFGVRFNDNVLIPKFSRFYFRNESFRKSVIVLAQGSTRFNLSKVNFMKLTITIPSLEEQTKIAEFLSAIDKQIETVENQITKTETYKKGLLQQMFV